MPGCENGKDGTKWFGTKWSWNEVTGYRKNKGKIN